jgi:hypothetical protein
LPIFDGVITIDESRVPVIVGVEPDTLRLSANGTEIGEWSSGEFSISERGQGVYAITADNETIEFVPNRPDLFAAGVGRPAPTPRTEAPDTAPLAAVTEPAAGDEVPPPQPMTRALFYTLAGTTAALGLWALYNLFT